MVSAFLRAGIVFLLLFLVFFVAERRNGRRRHLRIIVALCIIAASACAAWLAVQARPLEYEQVCVLATRRQNPKAKDNALYLTGAFLGDRPITLSAGEEAYWNLSSNWYVWRETEADATEPLSSDSFCFDIPTGRQRSLEFFTNAFKGIVQIKFQEETCEVDCYSESDGRIRVDLPDTPAQQLAYQSRDSIFTAFLTFLICGVLLLNLWFGLCWLYDRTGKARLRYEELWRTLSGWRGFLFYTAHYTALFGILCILIFMPFIKSGKTFLWEIDAIPQYLPTLIRQSRKFRESLASLLRGGGWIHYDYDFYTGLVKHTATFSLSQLILVFWRADRIDHYYHFLILMRVFCAGLSLSCLGLYYRKKPMPVLIGAIAYSFSNYTLYFGIRHPDFTGPMVFLPLLLIGVEKLVKKERPYLFVAMVFLSLAYSPYFAAMLAILTVLFAMIRWFAQIGKPSGKDTLSFFLRFLGFGFLAFALSGMILIPYLLIVFGTGRIGQNVASGSAASAVSEFLKAYLFFPTAYYKKFLSAFLVTPGHIGYSLCLGFPVLSFPAFVVLFYRKERSVRTLRASLILVTLLALSPMAAYIFSGFSTYSHRWSYAYALVVSFVLIWMLPDMAKADKKRDMIVLVAIVIYAGVCCAFGKTYIKTAFYGVILLTMALAAFCIARSFGARQAMGAALVITCVSVWFSSFLLYDPGQRDYSVEFVDKGQEYMYYNNSIYSVFASSDTANDEDFYRVSGSGITLQSLGSAVMYRVNGLTFSNSYYFRGYADWVNGMETVVRDEKHHHYGPGNRLGVLSLANVKYYVWHESDHEVMPYGFEKVECIGDPADGIWILKNRFWLPVGFTTTAYLTQDEYASLSAIEKQEVQLQAVVLDSLPANVQQYEHIPFESHAEQLPIQIVSQKGVKFADGELSVNRQNAEMELEFEQRAASEYYLRVVGLDLTGSGASNNWVLTAQSDNGIAYANFSPDSFLYASGMHTQILNLGYSENGLSSCTIILPEKGTFQLEDLEIWRVPTDRYAQQIDRLREETLENAEWGDDRLRAEIHAERSCVLQIVLPYSKAWRAWVDGEETEIYQADEAWMAIELEAGDHTVELRYQKSGKKAGIAVSAVGMVALVMLLMLGRRATHRRTGQPSNAEEDRSR